MRRLVIGLSGLMLAASTGCSVCQSYLDGEYSAYGGRWDRGAVAEHGDRTHRIAGRVGSEFHPAEAIRPADDSSELIPPGTPLTDDGDAPNSSAGDGAAGDGAANDGATGDGAANDGATGEGPDAEAGEGNSTPLTPPAPEQDKAKPAPAPPGRASAPAKKAAKANAAGRAPNRTRETNWAAKPSRPAARVRQTPANQGLSADASDAAAPAADEPAGAAADPGAAGDAGEPSDDAAAPSTEAGDEAMTDGSESDASGALLQPPANE